ncbi:hypothetical protein JCM11251_003127 [Rhodosporidiobolus azoricus]
MFTTAQAGGEGRGASDGGVGGFSGRDSPYFPSNAHSASSTPSHHDSHFDPHDPAWFTPSLASSSSSTHLAQGGFISASVDYPHFGAEAGEGECEILADAYGMEGYDLAGMRRYSEGDGQSIYSLSSSASAADSSSYLKSSIYADLPASTSFFDSEYTLAPAAAPLSSSYSSSSLHSSSAYSQGQPSYPSSALHTPAHEVPSSSDVDVEMTFSPTSVDPSEPGPWMYDYSRPMNAPTELDAGTGTGGSDPHFVESQQNGAYSLNVVSTTQTYATINYSSSPSSMYPPGHPIETTVPFPTSSSNSTGLPSGEALFSAPSARSSTSSGVGIHPSPFITQSGTSSACTSVHPTPALQPSPFIGGGPPSSSPAPAAHPPGGKQRSSLSGPTTSTGTPRRSRRPSLAHAHTQATPELSVIHQGQEQLLEGANTSPARHHSFSGPTAGGGGGVGPSGAYPSGTVSATVNQGGFSPYPSRHHPQQPPPQSPYARRRSSSHALSASAGASAGSPMHTATGRRVSSGPGGLSTAPGTPNRLVFAGDPATGSSRTGSPALGVPFPPSTPTRRAFSTSAAASSSPSITTPNRASPTAAGGSSGARRNNLGLTISVDAASSLSPRSRVGSAHGGGRHSITASPSPYSPYSPFSPSHPPSSAYPYPPPLASPSASRKRRFSAEAAATMSAGLASGAGRAQQQAQLLGRSQQQQQQQQQVQEGTSGSSLAGFAGGAAGGAVGGAAGGGVALKGLATTFEEEDRWHSHDHHAFEQDSYQHPQSVHLDNSSSRGPFAPAPVDGAGSFGTPYQAQQFQHQHHHHHHHHQLDPHGQQLPLDGTVGLGLEMGVEELHLNNTSTTPLQSDGVSPTAFVSGGAVGGVVGGMVYEYEPSSGQHQHQHAHQLQGPLLHHSQSQPELYQSGGSSEVLYYPQQQQRQQQHQQSARPTRRQQQNPHQRQHPQQQPYPASTDAEQAKSRLEQEIRAYLRAENRLELGEKTVVVMSPKIAQRSYGTEKRLLAPPPMALLLGSSWWSTLDSHPCLTLAAAQSGRLPSPPSPLSRATLPPEIFISISTDKEPLKHAASLSWMAPEGKLVLDREEDDAPPISGRAVSKSLAVSVPGELNKDVSTTVRTVVSIAEPGAGDVAGRVWAMVPGRPITVISKPSKKKAIAAGAVAGLTHGTLVSLYNRTKTYTGSTRYLCTSGLQSMFPLTDWSQMVGESAPRAFAPNDIRDVRFTSKSTAWDAFIIYAVDLDPEAASRTPPTPLHETYPKPPPSAIPLDKDDPKPLYYNQTIVLQDLSTGVISPILILRRCDAKAVAVGGGSIDDLGPNPADVKDLPVAPGEQLGEPVSQYRPIALEVFQNISKDRSDNAFEGKLPDDSFLGIADDEVGVHLAQEKRTYVRSPREAASQPITPTTPRSFAAMQLNQSSSSAVPKTEPIDLASFVDPADPTAKMKRPRRTSSSNAIQTAAATASLSRPPGTLAKTRKRGQSLTGVPQLGTSGFKTKKDGAKIWTIPVGDHCVWSIVNVEVGRHTFYVPPSVEGGKPPSLNPSSMHNPLYSVLRPLTAIGPHLPTVSGVEWPADLGTDYKGMLAINGENLSQDLAVWVGDMRSPFPAVVRSPHLLLFQPPQPSAPPRSGMHFLSLDTPASSKRISLVRPDGVVFLTPFVLPDLPEPFAPVETGVGRSRRR